MLVRRFISFSLLSLFNILSTYASTISGKVIDKETRFTLEFVQVKITGLNGSKQTVTDLEGFYEFKDLEPGIYNITANTLGYKPTTIFEVKVTNAKPVLQNIELSGSVVELDSINIGETEIDPLPAESPLSLRTLGAEDFERNPGGARDVSKVIRSLPGVAATPAFRNDIIIRGGSPNENRFYLDGIEVPNINHFATQGASGGPVGLINVNFVEKVDFYSGAFPANRGNALSSIISFKFKDGRKDTTGFRATLGSSDIGLTVEGPIGKKASYLASVRRSYLQLLFRAIGLPFLPTYNDAQFKVKVEPNNNSELVFIGLGALDDFVLNESVNDNVTDPDRLRANEFILNNVPTNEQWNYTIGAKYTVFGEQSVNTFVLSRNALNNRLFRHENNDESLPLTTDYTSTETENKFRYEHLRYNDFADVTYTLNLETARSNTRSRLLIPTATEVIASDYNSDILFLRYGGSVQASKSILKDKLTLSAGVRFDGSSFSSALSNPLEQFSPRISASYKLTNRLSLNANVGIYHQLPAYTALGFVNNNNELENRDNGISYIENTHYVAGLRYVTKFNAIFSVEGFLKNYRDYPFLTREGLSLANLGGDFGIVGNAPVLSNSTGQTSGLEFLYQQKLTKGFFGIVAYTFVNSRFSDQNGDLAPSAWDSRNIVNVTFGKKFKRNWQVGLKFRYSGGLPYTPYNEEASALRSNWDQINEGIFDFSQVNTLRLQAFHGLDIRVDKEYFFKKWSLTLYIDIENLYAFAAEEVPTLDVVRDEDGDIIVLNPDAPIEEQIYQTELLQTGNGARLPTLGIILDF